MEHDASYRLLFSHRELVADLLRGFLPPEWVSALDLDSLQRLNASYVSERLDRRDGDVVWRIRWGPRWCYVIVLLEFQSTSDPRMALRIASYGALLYQELQRDGTLGRGNRLPALLPVVLYNGARPWIGAATLSALIETPPQGLERYQLNAQYLLIDAARLRDERLNRLERNVAAALFRLERSTSPATLREIVHTLRIWLASPEQSGLRSALAVWVRRVLLPLRLPGVEIP